MSPFHSPFPHGLQHGGSGSATELGVRGYISGGAGVAVVGITPCIPGHLEVSCAHIRSLLLKGCVSVLRVGLYISVDDL